MGMVYNVTALYGRKPISFITNSTVPTKNTLHAKRKYPASLEPLRQTMNTTAISAEAKIPEIIWVDL
jgi:hypothetical protein